MRRQLSILIACLLLIFVFLLLIALLSVPRDPEYQGKPLSKWLQEYDSWNWQIKSETEALRQYGRSAEPLLKRMLQTRDSSVKTKLLKLLSKQSLIKIQVIPASVSQYKALQMCSLLGMEVKGTVPDIEDLVNGYPGNSKNSMIARFALNTLAVMGPDGIPGIIQALSNKDSSIRVRAAEILGTASSSATEEGITALKKSLNTGDALLKRAASHALELVQQRRSQSLPKPATNWVENVNPPAASPFGLWDFSQGIEILSDSGLEQGQVTWKAEDIFGAKLADTLDPETGGAVFQNLQPDGFTHFVEWETPSPVTVRSFGLIATHSPPTEDFIRAFRSFRLYARNNASEKFTLVYSENIPVPYGQGPFSCMLFLFRNLENPVQARQFRAEFVQNGSGPWHGPRPSVLYGFSVPLNQPMILKAVRNQGPFIQDEARRLFQK